MLLGNLFAVPMPLGVEHSPVPSLELIASALFAAPMPSGVEYRMDLRWQADHFCASIAKIAGDVTERRERSFLTNSDVRTVLSRHCD